MAKLTRSQRKRLARSLPARQQAVLQAVAPALDVQRAIEDVQLSAQARFTNPSGVFTSVYRWVKEAELSEPEWSIDSTRRDRWLREFVKREPHLIGVLNSVVQVDGNRGWELTGGRNQVYRYTSILHDNYFVTADTYGWRPGLKTSSRSFYNSDIGSVVEVGREGNAGPLRALFHVDSARCRLTGDPDKPLRYLPANGGAQEWGIDDYFRLTSMASDDEAMQGLGFCAVSRCLELAKVMVAVYLHDQEQLGARAPRGLLLLKNISQRAWEEAMSVRDEQMESLERKYYGGLAVLAGMGPQDVDAKLVALSQLPLGFDLEKFTSLLMYGYALAFGYDAREFWPVSSGSFGTVAETETQHRKATGKGRLDFALAYQENLQRLLPETIDFQFDQTDAAASMLEATLKQAQTGLATTLYGSGLQQGVPIISREEARMLLAEEGLIPEEWTLAQEDVTATDTEDADAEAEVPIDTASAPTPQDAEAATAAAPETVPVAERRRLQDWAMSLPSVRRAIELYPQDAIVRVKWPTLRETVIWRPGEWKQHTVWQGMATGDATNPKAPRGEFGANMLSNGQASLTHSETPKRSKARSVPGVTNQYRDEFTTVAEELMAAGKKGRRSASARLRALVKEYATEVYLEGMRDGGITDAETQLEPEDERAIAAWVNSQLPHIQSFVDAVLERGNTGPILERIEYWSSALETLGGLGRISAEQNMMLTWGLNAIGNCDDHCDTCVSLDGQRHRASWWRKRKLIPREPGSQKLACKGYRCCCALLSDDGERII